MTGKTKAGKRVSLVEQQTTFGVKDPSDHAKRQVKELDKTAKKSKDRRKKCEEQMANDKKEIAQINKRLEEIHRIYDPLCESLKEKLEKKEHLIKMLTNCKDQEKGMMGQMKGMVNTNMIQTFKQNRNAATFKLESLRGYTIKPESTFSQKARR